MDVATWANDLILDLQLGPPGTALGSAVIVTDSPALGCVGRCSTLAKRGRVLAEKIEFCAPGVGPRLAGPTTAVSSASKKKSLLPPIEAL